MKVLVIDPDALTRRSIELCLRSNGMFVELTDSGEDGVQLASLFHHDLVILGDDTFDARATVTLDKIVRLRKGPPVLAISEDSDVERLCAFLEGGADDYMVKPVHLRELVSRVNAVVRRSQGRKDNIVTTGALRINLTEHRVFVEETPVHLTGSEFKILAALSARMGRTVSKEHFLTALYGSPEHAGDIKIVDVLLCKIRKKLRLAGADNMIVTDWGKGYSLRQIEPPTTDAAAAA